MRKFLLLTALAAVVQFSSAQAQMAKPHSLGNPRITAASNEDRPVVLLPQTGNPNTSHVTPNGHHTTTHNEKSLLNGTPLNSQKIGTAGNLLTITTFNCNQLYTDNTLNVVSFVHRSDPAVVATSNIAQYSYDYSKDGGNTWKANIGPITNAPNIDNNGDNPHGRFPQSVIYNPANNHVADSAYLIYSGTWHNAAVNATSGTWVGQMRGRGHFNYTGDSSSFNVHVDTINNGTTNISTGMCQGAPGVFWAVNQDWTGTFSTSSNDITRGIIVEKGVWDSVTRDVVWTSSEIYQQFDSFTSGSVIATAAESFDIAFDPTGQYGWISCLGDITNNPTDSVNHPIFWKTTDGGNTWSSAMQIALDSLPGVVNALNGVTLYTTSAGNAPGAITSGIPTTSFQAKLSVDYAGRPHLLCTVGNGGGYSIESGASYNMYDITLNPNDTSCRATYNGWAAVFIDSVATLRGNTTADATPLTEDNRPLISRSADGKTMFFFWLASDPNYPGGAEEGDNNANPNLWGRGFDLVHATSTPSVNLTAGDPNFGGATASTAGGTFNGAFYPTVSPIALKYNGGYTIPLVLTQIDITGANMSSGAPQFWYINNLNFSQFDFTNGPTATLTPIGADTVILLKGTAYTDSGAIINYLDTACTHSGLLHVVTNGSGLNDTVPGTYFYYYAAEDANGNIYATGQRVIIVVSAPKANFTFQQAGSNAIQFTDSSLYNPTSWAWSFGDGGNDVQQNPLHQYATYGNYNVCLIATNAYGSSAQVCKQINVVNGINQIDFSSTVNMFPNPTSSNVTITLSGNSIPDFTVSVYNVLGAQVMATSDYKSGTSNVELNAATLADGVYLVKIQSNQGSAVKRLTVSHK